MCGTDFYQMIYSVVNATLPPQRKKSKLYSSNCRLCHKTGDFCLTDSLVGRWIVSLWRIFTLIYPDIDSRTSWWFSWINSNFTSTDHWSFLRTSRNPGLNLCTLLRSVFSPQSGCVSCGMVLSPALLAGNQNLHSPLPANFCPWQPRLCVIFLLLIIW